MRAAAAIFVISSLALAGCSAGSGPDSSKPAASSTSASSTKTKPSATPSTASLKPAPPASGNDSSQTVMKVVGSVTGGLTPKSVDASGTGLVIANNMIYKHTVTLFDAPSGKRIADIPDTVDLADFGLSKKPLKLTGGPVEAVWSKDGKYVYVSNYKMKGDGYTDEPNDLCKGTENYKPSYVYRIDVTKKKIDEVIPVGAVPKYVALTPDGKKLLVSNWCSYSLSVVDLASKKTEQNIPVARWPRGIATSPDSRYAYVAGFGTDTLYRVDLQAGTSAPFAKVGKAARHVTASPDGQYLYVVSSHANTVSKVDRATGRIVAQTKNLMEPRSMTISPDGKAIYVVNYNGKSVTKIKTATMERAQVVFTSFGNPIGITYEPKTGQVWVANYTGTIDVFDDNSTGPLPSASASATPPAGAKPENLSGE